MPDGSVERFYVDLPEGVAVFIQVQLGDAPTMHQGSPIPDSSVETLGRFYFNALERIVDEAELQFGRREH